MRPILFYLLFFVFFTSCKNEVSKNSESEEFQYIDYRKSDFIYKLRILDEVDEEFYDDQFGYTDVKLTQRIYVKDKCFGNRDTKNWESAEKFASKNGFPELTLITNISLPTKKNKYKTVWRAYQYCQYDSIYKLYGTTDGAMFELKQGEIKYKDRNDYRCLRIIRQDPDDNSGFKMQILSFVKLKDSWKLAQREKINTEKDMTRPSYCYDTELELNYRKDKVFELYRNTFEFDEGMICK